MGLTGFNRQRKRALSSELDIDERLADKLLAFGYSNPDQVKKAKDLPFLSEKERKQLKSKKGSAELDGGEKQSEGLENPKESDLAISDELDEEFLALPDDTEFPYQINAGWHYLSNGEKVNGKTKAQQLQAELDGG